MMSKGRWPIVQNLIDMDAPHDLISEWAIFCYDNGGNGPSPTPPMEWQLEQEIKKLEEEEPHRDGFDDAYIDGYRLMLKMYKKAMWSDGSPPEGLEYNHWFGLRDALGLVLGEEDDG